MSMRSIACLLWLASALNASAQYTTNYYPAVSNAWWALGPIVTEIEAAVNERAAVTPTVAQLSLGTINWVRRGHLSDLGDKIEELADVNRWANIEGTRTAATNDYDTYLSGGADLLSGVAGIESWTATGLIASVSASTSIYWAAEDAGGWDFWAYKYAETLDEFKAAINKLTEYNTIQEATYLIFDDQGESGYLSGTATHAAWATAKANAESGASAAGGSSPPRKWTQGNLDGDYTATLGTEYTYAKQTHRESAATNYHNRLDVYMWSEVFTAGATYDANGDGGREDKYTLANSSPITNLLARYVDVGDTNLAVGTWVGTPASASYDFRGYRVNNAAGSEIFGIADFAVTNGFQYVP